MSGWFQTGKDAMRPLDSDRNTSDFRFFLKSGKEATVAFCDGDNTADEPIGHFREHVVNLRDSRAPGYASCSGPSDCPLCRAGLRPYDAWPFTIIQIKPTWTDRDDKEHRNQKRLMVVKMKMFERILRLIEQRRGLTGSIWTLFRSSKTAFTVGDDWQFQEKISGGRIGLAKHLGIQAESGGVSPINYREDLKPKTQAELDAMGADIEATKRQENEWSERDRAAAARGGDRGGDRGSSRGGSDQGGSRGGSDQGGSRGSDDRGGSRGSDDRGGDRGAGVRY